MAAVSVELRLRRFRDMLAVANGENVVDYDFGSEAFTAKVRGRTSGSLMLAATTTSSHCLQLFPRTAAVGSDEILVFGFNSGWSLESFQDGREIKLEAGEMAFVAQSRGYKTVSGGIGQRIYLHVPRSNLVERLGTIDDLSSKRFSATLPAQRLATRYFAGLGASLQTLEDAAFERRFADGLDLLAFAMQDQLGGSLANTTVHRSALRVRLKCLIVSRLKDSGFSLAEAAAIFGVSSRYINNLLADEATSFGRFLLERRLLACRRELGDPRFVTTSVIDIAFRWGFNDAAHFSRAFKARFGLPPRDYQRVSTRRRLEADSMA